MSRPRKCRRVCKLPESHAFGPLSAYREPETVVITVDEYECLRLMDLAGLTQEECAARMDIARTTVQRIYDEVRGKVADCIVNGKKLRIKGGDYVLCDGEALTCADCSCCGRKKRESARFK